MGKRIGRKEVEGLELLTALLEKHAISQYALLKNTLLAKRAPLDPRRRFTDAQRRDIYARDAGICFYCGTWCASDAWQADHVLPHSRGGRTTRLNGVVACPSCNNAKSAKVW